MSPASEIAGNSFGDWCVGADFAGDFAVRIGFEGDGDFYTSDETHFIEH